MVLQHGIFQHIAVQQLSLDGLSHVGFYDCHDTWARQSNREIFERAELSRRFNLDLEIASRARANLTDETQYVFSTRSVRAGHSNFTMYLRASSPQSYILIPVSYTHLTLPTMLMV